MVFSFLSSRRPSLAHFSVPWRLIVFSLLGISSLHAAPAITTQPVDASVTSGTTASFTVAATGSGPLSYQWRRNGFALSGATASTFTLAPATRVDADFYSVLVTDSNGSTASATARLSVAPTAMPNTVAPDPAWNLQLESPNRTVNVLASVALPDGGFLIAGNFSSVNGLRRSGLVRINRDGSINSSFVPPEMDGEVSTLAVQRNGMIVVGGSFTRAGAFPRHKLARLNPDGTVDPAFTSPLPIGATEPSAIVVQADDKVVVGTPNYIDSMIRYNADGSRDADYRTPVFGSVYALGLQPDGKLLVGGFLSQPRTNLARLNVDGSADLSFTPITGTAIPHAIAVQSDGRVIVGGNFSSFAGVPVGGIVRLTATGAVDPTFAVGNGVGTGTVKSIVFDASQRILIAGQFSNFGGNALESFVRLNANGSIDTSFAQSRCNGPVNTISVAPASVNGSPDGRIFVGGFYSTINTVTRSSAVRLSPTGVVDSGFSLTFRWVTSVTAIAALPGGKFLLAGEFAFARGVAVPTGLIRVNADGTVDNSFNAGVTGVGANGAVNAIAVLPDGRIAIGGFFLTYNGVPCKRVALLTPAGALDPTFSRSTGFDDPDSIRGVHSIAVLPGNRLAFGGNFLSFNGVARNHLAVTHLDGTLDPSFSQTGTGFNNGVKAISVQKDGKLVVGGEFTTYAGVAARHFARLNTDGTLDSPFVAASGGGVGAINDTLTCLAVRPDGKIVLGGSFANANGGYSFGVLRFNADGSRDTTFASSGFYGVVALACMEDGSVLARGFMEFSNPDLYYLVRLTASGARDPSFAAAAIEKGGDYPACLIVRDDGQILTSSSPSTHGLLVTRTVLPPTLLSQPVSQSVGGGARVTFSVTSAPSPFPISYQWSLNGVPIFGATNATYTVGTARPSDAGSYTVTLSSELGTVTSAEAILTGIADPPRLINVSTRTNHGLGDQGMIAGFVIAGTAPKNILLRVIGPTLANFGVSGTLADPTVELYRNNTILFRNDDWNTGSEGAQIALAATRVGAFPLPSSKDSALYQVLQPGAYSAVVRSSGNLTGTALVEVYDASDPLADSSLVNISTRAEVTGSSSVLIAGFVVSGNRPKRLLIRAAGPALGPLGVSRPLADPMLEIASGEQRIAANDNWDAVISESPATAAAAVQVGAFAFAPGSRDSALLVQLPPGAYTAVVRGAGQSSGTALVEVYEVP